ncbi:MAG TPA: GNAT family N-acetyltransferase [Coleofasciculaceae cyanobacterium]
MNYQQIQLTEDLNRPWIIVRILPDARHYPVAKFHNRQDAQDYLRVLHRFIPTSNFKIIFDAPISTTNNLKPYRRMPMKTYYRDFLIRSWTPCDREAAAAIIRDVLTDYGLPWEPTGADRDVLEVEASYINVGGEFWVIEQQGQLVGTGAYYPVERGEKAVEIRKMYLSPAVRGQGLGRYLLQELERAIAQRGFREIWVETASVLKEAVKLYESSGYQPATGVETKRCDRVYVKSISPSKNS